MKFNAVTHSISTKKGMRNSSLIQDTDTFKECVFDCFFSGVES